jgi:hypothetical protein
MRQRNRMAWLAVATAGLLAVLAGACAGEDPNQAKVASIGGTTTTTGGNGGSAGDRNPEEQALAFARCMRAHGVDVPDPKFGGDGKVEFGMRGKVDAPKFKAAESACQKQVGGPFGAGKGQADPKMQEAMLEFARCMRQHGVAKFPDPQPGGGLLIRAGSGLDPQSPTFKAAEKACSQLLPRVDRSTGRSGR